MMAIGKMFMGNDSDAKLARKFKSIRILDLEACSTSVKERFSKKINAQRIKDYETLVQVNDEGEKVHILAKSKNDVIRERRLHIGTVKGKSKQRKNSQTTGKRRNDVTWTPLVLNNNFYLAMPNSIEWPSG